MAARTNMPPPPTPGPLPGTSRGAAGWAALGAFMELLPAASSADACAVCLERVGRGRRLPCGHVFHGACVARWAHHTPACPLCRRRLPVARAWAGLVQNS